MSDNIATMNDKQLRKEVQSLRDELAIMQRKYEDIIYNLDTDNFSSRFVKEQGDMRTAITVTAKGIEAKVSQEDFESAISQTSKAIEAKVSTEEFESRLTLTATQFETSISNLYSTLSTRISQSQDDIILSAQKYVTDTLEEKNYVTQSEFVITADGISSRVGLVEDGEFTGGTLFTQSAGKFYFGGNVEISGNAVVGGTISGSVWQNSAGKIKLSLGDDYGVYGDLTLVKENYNGSVSHIFSVVDDVSIVDFKAMNERFMSATGNGGMPTVYAYGTWDFSDCKTTGLEAVAKFG